MAGKKRETPRKVPGVHDEWALRAAARGALPYLKVALELGADPNALLQLPRDLICESRTMTTPLIEAVVGRHAEAVELLMAAGGDPNLKVEEASALARANAPMALLLIGSGEEQTKAAAQAFAEALSEYVRFDTRRDWLGEFRDWVRSGIDPFAPLFDGRSLLNLIGDVSLDWHAGSAQSKDAGDLFDELCGKADTGERMARAFEASVKARRLAAAAKLARRGAAQRLAQETKDALADAVLQINRSDREEVFLALMEAGADMRSFATAVREGTCPTSLAHAALRANPGKTIRLVDSQGRGLLHQVVETIVKYPNDVATCEANLALAEELLRHPDAHVLAGNGLGRHGPPVVRLAHLLGDDAFTNQRRANRFAKLRKSIVERAMAEADEFGETDVSLDLAGTDGMNILHLAAVCMARGVSDRLIERASGLGKAKLRSMLSQVAGIHEQPFERFGSSPAQLTPPTCAVREGAFHILLAFSRLVGFNARFEGRTLLDRLAQCLSFRSEDDLGEDLEAMFGAGLDPEATLDDGSTLHEEIKRNLGRRFHSNAALAERYRATIEQAFTKAAGSRRKPKAKAKDAEPPRPVSRSNVL